MKIHHGFLSVGVLLAAILFQQLPAVAQPVIDPGWPRLFQQSGQQLTIYQPQVDFWNGYTNIHFRCAISVKGVTKEEKFGVIEIDAVTVVDRKSVV